MYDHGDLSEVNASPLIAGKQVVDWGKATILNGNPKLKKEEGSRPALLS